MLIQKKTQFLVYSIEIHRIMVNEGRTDRHFKRSFVKVGTLLNVCVSTIDELSNIQDACI